MNLFSSTGLMIKLPADSTILSLYLEDDYDPNGVFNFQNRQAIITSYSTKESSLVQLRQMFNDKIYFNVFGDRPGLLSINGLYAAKECNSKITGFELMAAYYRKHRASRKILPVDVAIGGFFTPVTYSAFLMECQLANTDPQLMVGQFSMQFVYPMDVETVQAVTGGFLSNPDEGMPTTPLNGQVGDFPNPGTGGGDSQAAINNLP